MASYFSLVNLLSLILVLVLSSPGGIQSANILFLFGGGNVSHKMSIWPFVRALAEAGHNVTFTSSSPKTLPGHPSLRDLTPKAFSAFTSRAYEVDRFTERLAGNNWDLSTDAYDKASLSFCSVLFGALDEDPAFGNVIRNGQIELVIINLAFNECGFYLAHHLGAKSILYSSSILLPWFHGVYGVPMEMSWIPYEAGPGSHPMGLLARIRNMYYFLAGYERRAELKRDLEEMYRRKFGLESAPGLTELERNVSLVFLNTHHATDFARSLPPMFVNIGGTQCWSPLGELPTDFKVFMDGAEEGVVLISFGSTVTLSSLSEFYIGLFFNTMRKFSKVGFIWRWEGPSPENPPTNLLASEWLPQKEILNHPKTIAFMTHCGQNSMMEATFHGVPIIGLPLFADQDYNAYRIGAQEVGVVLEARELSQERMDTAFEEVLHNPKYKRNMKRRSGIFKDRSQSPIAEAVYWTEFVLRQADTSALKPMLLDQPWYARTSIDVYLALVIIFGTVPLTLSICIFRIFKYFYY